MCEDYSKNFKSWGRGRPEIAALSLPCGNPLWETAITKTCGSYDDASLQIIRILCKCEMFFSVASPTALSVRINWALEDPCEVENCSPPYKMEKKAQGKDVLSHLWWQYRQELTMVVLLPGKGRTENPGALKGWRKMSLLQSEECQRVYRPFMEENKHEHRGMRSSWMGKEEMTHEESKAFKGYRKRAKRLEAVSKFSHSGSIFVCLHAHKTVTSMATMQQV